MATETAGSLRWLPFAALLIVLPAVRGATVQHHHKRCSRVYVFLMVMT